MTCPRPKVVERELRRDPTDIPMPPQLKVMVWFVGIFAVVYIIVKLVTPT